jgi:hypothetical protein
MRNRFGRNTGWEMVAGLIKAMTEIRKIAAISSAGGAPVREE